MVDGESLVHGMSVQCLVEVQSTVDTDLVTVLLLSTAEMTVQLTDHLILKQKDAMKIHVQVI